MNLNGLMVAVFRINRASMYLIGLAFCIVLVSRFVLSDEGRSLERLDRTPPSTYLNGCHLEPQEFNLLPCFTNQTSNDAEVYLVGDSHAAQWIPGIEAANEFNTFDFRFVTKSSCPFVQLNLNLYCDKWVKVVTKDIKKFKPDKLIVSSLTNAQYLSFYSKDAYAKLWLSGFESIIKSIPRNTQIIVIEDTPYSFFDTSECLLSNHESKCKFHFQPSELTLALRNFARERNIAYVSLNEGLCPAFECLAGNSSMNYYRDHHHISASASKKFGPSLLRKINEGLLEQK